MVATTTTEQFQKPADPYPIPFEHAWKILGYSKKDKAKDALYQEFVEGEDFIVFPDKGENPSSFSPQGGRPEEMLRLSWECFVHFNRVYHTHN